MSRSDGRGVFPSQMIAEAIKQGWVLSGEGELPAQSIQPASLDLRLGDVAYRLRCSFLPDDEIRRLHASTPLLYRNGVALTGDQIAVSNGLFMGLHLGREAGQEVIGYRAKENSELIDLSKTDHYAVRAFWEEVLSEGS